MCPAWEDPDGSLLDRLAAVHDVHALGAAGLDLFAYRPRQANQGGRRARVELPARAVVFFGTDRRAVDRDVHEARRGGLALELDLARPHQLLRDVAEHTGQPLDAAARVHRVVRRRIVGVRDTTGFGEVIEILRVVLRTRDADDERRDPRVAQRFDLARDRLVVDAVLAVAVAAV